MWKLCGVPEVTLKIYLELKCSFFFQGQMSCPWNVKHSGHIAMEYLSTSIHYLLIYYSLVRYSMAIIGDHRSTALAETIILKCCNTFALGFLWFTFRRKFIPLIQHVLYNDLWAVEMTTNIWRHGITWLDLWLHSYILMELWTVVDILCFERYECTVIVLL